MGLFDKKYCSICGNEIKFLGNRKVSDGNMCKDCASKLSPFFSDRRASTVEEIKAQLAYRAENEAKLSSLSPSKVLGNGTKIYLDESKHVFVVNRNKDFKANNPDIIDLSQVMDVTYEIEEDKDEIFDKDAEGNEKSFDPPKYEYEYDFDMKLAINHPYFDEIKFSLVEGTKPDSKDSTQYKEYVYQAKEIQHYLKPNTYPMPNKDEIITESNSEEGTWTCSCGHENPSDALFCSKCGKEKAQKWFCPKCGRENTDNFCAKCGTEKPKDL